MILAKEMKYVNTSGGVDKNIRHSGFIHKIAVKWEKGTKTGTNGHKITASEMGRQQDGTNRAQNRHKLTDGFCA